MIPIIVQYNLEIPIFIMQSDYTKGMITLQQEAALVSQKVNSGTAQG